MRPSIGGRTPRGYDRLAAAPRSARRRSMPECGDPYRTDTDAHIQTGSTRTDSQHLTAADHMDEHRVDTRTHRRHHRLAVFHRHGEASVPIREIVDLRGPPVLDHGPVQPQ